VVDVVGGADLLHSVNSLRYGGRIALLGVLGKEDEPVSLTQPLLFGGKSSKLPPRMFRFSRFLFLDLYTDLSVVQGRLGGGSRDMMVELSAFAEKHQLHPPITQVFKFEEANKALDALREFTGVGKIVVEV
jgi:NADPH:quinone reductase-like Zn-dependent oxidoreductase